MIKVSHIAARSEVLRDVSFELASGERLALVGANGSGKSTLLHAILGLQSLSKGSIRVEGLDPQDAKQVQEVRRLVGYVQQRPDDQIVATSVEDDVAFGPENLGLPVESLRKRVDEALAQVGLTGLEKREPHTLSGGQKQRLVIAGALALRPNYLVLDEPTAQLDPQGKKSVLEVLANLQKQGTGILQVTHDIDEMALADRVAVLFDGEIVFEGSFEELQAQQEHFEKWGIDSGLAPVELSPFAGDDEQRYTLRASELSLSYKVGTQVTAALKEANLEVSSGELVVIKGDTGSGKSTLLSILANLANPDTGQVDIVQASHPDNAATDDIAARLVFQDPELQLFSETVLDDVAFGPRNLGTSNEDAQEAAKEAMTQVGLPPKDFADRSPFLLSGGEARRAAIAGIVAMKPHFFLADEPTSALDAQGRDKVRKLIASLTKTSGVIVVTHNPEQFAQLATRVYRIEGGVLSLAFSADSPSAGRDMGTSARPRPAISRPSDNETKSSWLDFANAARDAEGNQGLESSSAECAEIPISPPTDYTSGKGKKKRKTPASLNFSLYIPGNSILHRADPRTKIIAAALLITALFSYLGWIPILGVFALVVALVILVKVPLGPIAKMMRPLGILIIFTLLIHSMSWQPLGFSLEGFARGGLFTLRLVDVMMLSLLVTLTTSPVALTDGLTLLMKPLRKIRVPIDDIAMILSIALRFIPTIMEEALTIVRAQTARGAPFDVGNIFSRLKAWIPVIIPLLVQLFRRADTLAIAMATRCYLTSADTQSGKHPTRTRLRQLKLQRLDLAIMLFSLVAAIAIIVVPRVLS